MGRAWAAGDRGTRRHPGKAAAGFPGLSLHLVETEAVGSAVPAAFASGRPRGIFGGRSESVLRAGSRPGSCREPAHAMLNIAAGKGVLRPL